MHYSRSRSEQQPTSPTSGARVSVSTPETAAAAPPPPPLSPTETKAKHVAPPRPVAKAHPVQPMAAAPAAAPAVAPPPAPRPPPIVTEGPLSESPPGSPTTPDGRAKARLPIFQFVAPGDEAAAEPASTSPPSSPRGRARPRSGPAVGSGGGRNGAKAGRKPFPEPPSAPHVVMAPPAPTHAA